MVDFSNVSKMAVQAEARAEYCFDAIVGDPVLTARPATEANRAYLNAVLGKGRKLMRKMRGKKMTPAIVAESREQDIELYARTVVVGWSRVRDAAGAEVPFGVEACEEFLRALPPEMFDAFRAFCSEHDNFRDAPPDEPDPEEAEGN